MFVDSSGSSSMETPVEVGCPRVKGSWKVLYRCVIVIARPFPLRCEMLDKHTPHVAFLVLCFLLSNSDAIKPYTSSCHERPTDSALGPPCFQLISGRVTVPVGVPGTPETIEFLGVNTRVAG